MVIDDRGHKSALVSPSELDNDSRQIEPRFCATLERVHTELQPRNSWPVFLSISAFIVILLLVGTRWLPWYAFSVLYVAVLIIAVVVSQSVARRRGTAPAAQMLIAAGLCPSCAYSLHGLPVEPDGCTVCTECGGAWLRARIHDDKPYHSATSIGGIIHTKRWLGRFIDSGRVQTIKDELHVMRTLVHPNLKREIAAAADPELGGRLRSAAKVNIAKGWIVRWLKIMGFAAIPAIFCLISYFAGVRPRLTFGVMLMAAMCLFPILRVLRNGTGISPKAIHREMLKRDLCPSCAADLRHCVPSEVTGFISCPRCTATWEPPPRYDPVPPQ